MNTWLAADHDMNHMRHYHSIQSKIGKVARGFRRNTRIAIKTEIGVQIFKSQKPIHDVEWNVAAQIVARLHAE
jgi:hypothetical protein